MTMLKHAWRDGAQRLRDRGIDTPLLDARLLIQRALGLGYEQFLAQSQDVIAPEQEQAFEASMIRRLAREPMAQILGHREFYGREFLVTRDVLCPRPETELLVEAVLKQIADLQAPCTILDLGTGSGCLLLTLLAELPLAVGTGVDISEAALDVARANAKKLGVEGRASFVRSRWYEELPPKKYQIILANPPYIPSNDIRGLMPEVAKYEPLGALDGGADGLSCYREIASQLPAYAAKGANVVLEIGIGQEESVPAIFARAGFTVSAVLPDLAGIPRCVMLIYE